MAKAKVKALLSTGLAALCSHIKQCATAVSALANTTADGFDEVDDVLHEKTGHHSGGAFYDSDDWLGEGFHPHQLLLL